MKKPHSALLAQLDRVTDYESVGQGFESLAAHHENRNNISLFLFFYCSKRGLEPPNGTTALIKRFCESFLAGEICESKQSDRNFLMVYYNSKRASAEQIIKILRSKSLFESLAAHHENRNNISLFLFFYCFEKAAADYCSAAHFILSIFPAFLSIYWCSFVLDNKAQRR